MTTPCTDGQATLPPVSDSCAAEQPTLIERLRHWPRYERSPAERSEAVGRWLSAVETRRRQGLARRILFIHGQLPGETGSGVYLQQIAAEAIRQGLDFHLLTAGYEPIGAAHIRGVPDERITTCRFTPDGAVPVAGAVKTPISGMSVVMPYPVLAYRDRSEAELIDWLTVFGGHIAERVSRLQPDVIHVNHLWLLNGLTRLAAPWIPLVTSAHGTAYKLIKDTPRFRDLVAPCAASADHVCAISPDSVAECVEMFAIDRGCITIEGYGYEPELFNWRRVDAARVAREAFGIGLTAGGRLVVAVGKFADWKGFKELTEAVGRLREKGWDVTAVIVGEGDPGSRADLERFIAGRGLSGHVHLPGKVAREALPDIYRAADVFVLPSHVEPYGMVLMEALVCGTPSVAARAGGPPDFVPRPLVEAGLAVLVAPIDPGTGAAVPSPTARCAYAGALVAGIEALLVKRIGDNERAAIAAAMTHLTWGRLVVRLQDVYERMAARAVAHLTGDPSPDLVPC